MTGGLDCRRRDNTIPLYLKTKQVDRALRKAHCSDATLIKAFQEISQGLIDAELGGNLYKKRMAVPGQGKRGSLRTIIATRKAERWVALATWAKNDMENIDDQMLSKLKSFGNMLLDESDEEVARFVTSGQLIEVKNSEKE